MNIRERQQKQQAKKMRVRAKAVSSPWPRLHVYRSGKHLYAQVIDDTKAVTVAAASDREVKEKGTKTEKAFYVGKLIAERAKKKQVVRVNFDRGGYHYAGRIKKLAEAAREHGLEF